MDGTQVCIGLRMEAVGEAHSAPRSLTAPEGSQLIINGYPCFKGSILAEVKPMPAQLNIYGARVSQKLCNQMILVAFNTELQARFRMSQ